jgi:hypothetical protein
LERIALKTSLVTVAAPSELERALRRLRKIADPKLAEHRASLIPRRDRRAVKRRKAEARRLREERGN